MQSLISLKKIRKKEPISAYVILWGIEDSQVVVRFLKGTTEVKLSQFSTIILHIFLKLMKMFIKI